MSQATSKKGFGFYAVLLAAVAAVAAGIYFIVIHGTFGLDSTHNGACYDPWVVGLLIGGAVVAVALTPLKAGETVDYGAGSVTPTEDITMGHKVALRDIAAGEKVIKYGFPIGVATQDIPLGSHVHTHNLHTGLSGALARAGVSLFAVSTYDTDYLFVKKEQWPAAISALTAEGYTVES